MSQDPNRPGQYPPPQWESQPQRGAYPAVPSQPPQNYRGPPPQGYPSNPSTPGEMVTLPPPSHQGQPPMGYPHEMYPPHGYPPHPPPPPHMAYPQQPAPRQRTAIACRYCRRRKIRCSGFENSEDGRCTNCARFQQECIFTPVSSQAQAFVPAHTAYPHLRHQPGHMPPQRGGRPIYPQHGHPAPLYGAHGQPLGPPMHDPNYPPPHPGGYGMPPQGYGPPYDQRGGPPPEQGRPQENVSLKRLRSTEFHPAVPAPIQNGEPSKPSSERLPAEPSVNGQAPPTNGHVSGKEEAPAPFRSPESADANPEASISQYSSEQSYPPPGGYPPPGAHPYYGQPPPQQQPPAQGPPPQPGQQNQPPRRPTPEAGTTPYYDARGSGSPHGSTSSVPAYQPYPPQGLHPPQVLPPTSGESRTPPPGKNDANGNGNSARAGMAVRDLLGPGQNQDQGSRTNTDSSMLNALNKKM